MSRMVKGQPSLSSTKVVSQAIGQITRGRNERARPQASQAGSGSAWFKLPRALATVTTDNVSTTSPARSSRHLVMVLRLPLLVKWRQAPRDLLLASKVSLLEKALHHHAGHSKLCLELAPDCTLMEQSQFLEPGDVTWKEISERPSGFAQHHKGAHDKRRRVQAYQSVFVSCASPGQTWAGSEVDTVFEVPKWVQLFAALTPCSSLVALFGAGSAVASLPGLEKQAAHHILFHHRLSKTAVCRCTPESFRFLT